MTYVQLSTRLHAHPTFMTIKPRACCAWLFSVLWLSRNGRIDTFPKVFLKEFGATPTVTKSLLREGLWVEEGDEFYVPQWFTGRFCRAGMELWRFGPAETQRPKIPDALRAEVYERDGHKCLHCGTTENLSLDHIHPFSLGGKDTLENLQTLCRRCNSRKGVKVNAT